MIEIKTATVYIGAGNTKYDTEAEAIESIAKEKFVNELSKVMSRNGYKEGFECDLYYALLTISKFRKEIGRILREMGDA